MGFDKILKDFCNEHGYTYRADWVGDKYHIVLSIGADNAGAFLSEEEYRELDEKMLQEILIFLDRQFKEKFDK